MLPQLIVEAPVLEANMKSISIFLAFSSASTIAIIVILIIKVQRKLWHLCRNPNVNINTSGRSLLDVDAVRQHTFVPW